MANFLRDELRGGFQRKRIDPVRRAAPVERPAGRCQQEDTAWESAEQPGQILGRQVTVRDHHYSLQARRSYGRTQPRLGRLVGDHFKERCGQALVQAGQGMRLVSRRQELEAAHHS